MTRFQFVADHQQRYGVKRLCQLVGVARSSFYYWRATAPDRAAREAADAALAVRIRAVQAVNDGTYGAPRITAELHEEGLAVNHKKVQRLWREEGLRVPQPRRRKRLGVSTVPLSNGLSSKRATAYVGRNEKMPKAAAPYRKL